MCETVSHSNCSGKIHPDNQGELPEKQITPDHLVKGDV
jgi:hypothetical protein